MSACEGDSFGVVCRRIHLPFLPFFENCVLPFLPHVGDDGWWGARGGLVRSTFRVMKHAGKCIRARRARGHEARLCGLGALSHGGCLSWRGAGRCFARSSRQAPWGEAGGGGEVIGPTLGYHAEVGVWDGQVRTFPLFAGQVPTRIGRISRRVRAFALAEGEGASGGGEADLAPSTCIMAVVSRW